MVRESVEELVVDRFGRNFQQSRKVKRGAKPGGYEPIGGQSEERDVSRVKRRMVPTPPKARIGVGERRVHVAAAILQPPLFHSRRLRRDLREPLRDEPGISRRALGLQLERAAEATHARADVRPTPLGDLCVGRDRLDESLDGQRRRSRARFLHQS